MPKTKKITCGAKTRSGKQCKNLAGFKTSHPGEGRCNLHGGATPIKTGTHSKVKSPENLQRMMLEAGLVLWQEELYDKAPDEAVLANQGIDSDILRARYMLWAIELGFAYRTEGGQLRPMSIQEIAKAIRTDPEIAETLRAWIDLASKLETRASRIRAMDAAFSFEDVLKMSNNIVKLVLKYVRDPADQQALMKEMKGVQSNYADRATNRLQAASVLGGDE